MRILIVEDHDGIRMALEVLLELEGHQPTSVDRGEEALRLIQDASFDLVLLDLTTNGVTAEEFMNRLRAFCGETGRVRPRVCILSASSHIEHEARRLGSDHWIRKPFDPSELMDCLESFHISSQVGQGGHGASDAPGELLNAAV